MNDRFNGIIFLAGKFGIVIREHVQTLVYTNKYSEISANRTLSKLEREHGYLKRIDRGKRKTDGYVLSYKGIKYFRELFGEEPKVFSSGDKLSHSIHILNFYCHIINDMIQRKIINEDINIIEDSNKIMFDVHKHVKCNDKDIIMDGFGIYRYKNPGGIVFILEIENSNRTSSLIANKTIKNYEGYFFSKEWQKEPWQNKDRLIFPPVLIVTYSDKKVNELIKWFNKKSKVNIKYYFTSYKKLEEQGISGEIWKDTNNTIKKILL